MTLTELDDLRDKLHKTQQHLQNLCARIHRDGGHYADEHGLETAVRDADVIVANTFSQLAKAQAEIERLKREVSHWKNNHETEVRRARVLKERIDMPIERAQAYGKWGDDQLQLAASQATNEKLRKALGKFRDNVLFRIGSASPYRKMAQEYFEYIAPILAIPNDTTALNKLLAGVYEECAKECDRLDYWYSARAIRALAKQKGLI